MVQATEQKRNNQELTSEVTGGGIGISEAERGKLLKQRDEIERQLRATPIPDIGGSQVPTTLSREQMLKATEAQPIAREILNPDYSAEAKVAKARIEQINAILSGNADLRLDEAYDLTNFALGQEGADKEIK